MTSSNGKRWWSLSICSASWYWVRSPVPKSPSTPNFSDPARLGSGMTSALVAGASTLTEAGRDAPQVPHAVPVEAMASSRTTRVIVFGMAQTRGNARST